MAFQKGHSRPSGSGRKKGVPNKQNALLRDMILQALNEQSGGGVEYLKRMSQEHPAAFMSLLAKLIPTQVTGEGGGSVHLAVERVIVHATVDEARRAENG